MLAGCWAEGCALPRAGVVTSPHRPRPLEWVCWSMVGMVGLLSSPWGWAQEPANLSPIVVQSQAAGDPTTMDAASSGAITGARMNSVPLQRPAEVLEQIPGMVVTQHSGEGKANQYFLRGYNLDHGTDFASFLEGVPVNLPSNAHGQGYSDLNFLIPELVERVDYTKGTYNPRFGDFSAAGAAEIQYRERLEQNLVQQTIGAFGYRRTLFAGSRTFSASANSASSPPASSQDLTSPAADSARAQLAPGDSAGGDEAPTLLSALELVRTQGPWTPGEGLDKYNGLLKASGGNGGAGWSVDGQFYQAGWNSTDQVPLSLIQSGQLPRYSALDPTDGGVSGRTIITGEVHHEDASGYDQTRVYAERYRLRLWSNFTFYELRPATGDQFEQTDQRWIYGGRSLRGWVGSWGGVESTTELGCDVRNDQAQLGLLDTRARVAFSPVRNDQLDETMAGAWLQNSLQWRPDLRTNLALREDHVMMHLNALQAPNTGGSAAASVFSPKASLILGPWLQTVYYLDAGRGFHSNDARGVIDRIDPTTQQPASTVPALAPALGEEVGMRANWWRGIESSLALWRLNSSSEIIYNADSTIGSTSPNGASERSGLEWSNHLARFEWMVVDLDLSWIRARYSGVNPNGQLGNYIPNAVGKVALLQLSTNRPGGWNTALAAHYIGSYPLSQEGGLSAPSAFITDLRLQRQLAPDLTFFADVLNLFNRQYFDIAYQQDYQVSPGAPMVPNGETVHPGEPRQLRATLAYSF